MGSLNTQPSGVLISLRIRGARLSFNVSPENNAKDFNMPWIMQRLYSFL